MDLRGGEAYSPMVQGGDAALAKAVALLLSWLCWLQATLMATGLATSCGHKPARSWPKITVPSHLGREKPGSSLPARRLAPVIRARNAQPAMSPALLRAPAQGGESQQRCHASHCPQPP